MSKTAERTYTCRECGAPAKWIGNPYASMFAEDGYRPVHADGTVHAGRRIEIAPQCPKCGSGDYTGSDTAWGIAHDCGACGHHEYFSIGD